MIALIALALAHAAGAAYLNESLPFATGELGPSPMQTFHSSSSTPIMFNYVVFPPSPPTESLLIAPRGTGVINVGPHIFDGYGELVWDGSELGETMALTTGTYQGNPVLVMWRGDFNMNGYGHGHGVIIDQQYKEIANISATVPGAMVDFHEVVLTDNNTALITIYHTEQMDLTPYGSTATEGYILVGYAQEIDLGTGEALWTWRSLDHVDPSSCYTTPGETGSTEDTPWDYIHINSVEKDANGNYLISSRHCNALYYISGSEGSLLWTLGGKNSSFTMGENTTFSWQHDARFHNDGNTVSIFDNAASNWQHDAPQSRGMTLNLDYDAKTATLGEEMLPFNGTLSESQGNNEVQPDGNWIIGWGSIPVISEHAPDGTLLWAAQLGAISGGVQNYQAHRGNWTAYPSTSPNMSIEASDSGYDVYISWNGATEVATWEILGSDGADGFATGIVNATRSGFETTVHLSDVTAQFLQARAISKSDTTLGWSYVYSTNGSAVSPPDSAQSSAVDIPSSPSPSSVGPGGTGSSHASRLHVSAAAVVLGVVALAIEF